jgi:hypothetical protein
MTHPSPSPLAQLYADQLLKLLNMATPTHPRLQENNALAQQSALDWAQSGLMPLCGARLGPGHIPSCAQGALLALRSVCTDVFGKDIIPATVNGAKLLSERAAVLNLPWRGAHSANGSCALFAAQDAWLAFNMPRIQDWEMLAALFQNAALANIDEGDWNTLANAVRPCDSAYLLAQSQLLGMAVARVGELPENTPPWHVERFFPAVRASHKSPLIIDLSALWAGPLCTHLLQLAGARVIKVENSRRPDAARGAEHSPHRAFYDVLNAGKQSIALELDTEPGRTAFIELLRHADIVVESARPRALRQMGIEAETFLRNKPGLCWLRITGYGTQQENRIAFGDDAAVAAGLVVYDDQHKPQFCGDAIADPLCGIHAALCALTYWQQGGGVLLDMSLAAVARHCLSFGAALSQFFI